MGRLRGFAIVTLLVALVADIASLVGAVGLVLKALGAEFMAPWSWGELLLVSLTSLFVAVVFYVRFRRAR